VRAVAKLRPAPGTLAEIDIPEPRLGAGEVLVRIAGVGLCGTDLALRRWDADLAREYAPAFPHILGHEFAGIVESLGADVTGPSPGTLVAVNPYLTCGRCRYCLDGRQSLCIERRIMGCHVAGGLAERVAVPGANVLPLPDGTDAHVAAILEPLCVSVHAVHERVGIRSGDAVLVMGAGPIGLLHAVLARQAGASAVFVAGVGADRERLAVARELGAVTIDQDTEDLNAKVRDVVPDGADAGFDTSGHPVALVPALSALRRGGRLGVVGYCHDEAPFNSLDLALTEREILGCRAYAPATWRRAAAQLPSLAADLHKLITHVLPFADIDRGLDIIDARAGIKVVLSPDA